MGTREGLDIEEAGRTYRNSATVRTLPFTGRYKGLNQIARTKTKVTFGR
jgi:hypothetical protein